MPASVGDQGLPRILICEGPDDVAFFQALIEAWRVPRFHITDTAEKKGESGGNTKFGKRLRSLQFRRNVTDIIIVSDNDENHEQTFGAICRQIQEAGFGPPPTQPLERIVNPGRPAITAMMLPLDGSPGNLQCVCGDAARNADRNVTQSVDHFVSLLHADNWPVPRKGKLWLRANLAARANDPFVFLGNVFREAQNQHLIPINDPSFKPIADAIIFVISPPAAPAQAQPSPSASPPGRKPARNRPRTQTRPRRGRSQ